MLSMLDKRSPAAPIIIVGHVASAVILGLETIDLAFDITILSGQAPALGIRGPGGQQLLPLEVAWICEGLRPLPLSCDLRGRQAQAEIIDPQSLIEPRALNSACCLS
ncbi:unnamed protein product [Prorocentrum cordatum]|uniref:Enoyl-CoA hydratase n=1 Tax=Prorocentrum cordatum TaxID=2364126 RepID=A0ABN9T285_9DINO|nr:unnamed protein product [Polarella glacialis]